MSWTSLLKASPTYGQVLTELVMDEERLFNRIESAKKGSKATGSKLFKDAFKKYPDLDTNYSSIQSLYEENNMNAILNGASKEEMLDKFSKMKTILGSKPKPPSRKIEHNAEFFDNLFKSDEEPSNIKDLLVIYQKKIAQSVPNRTRTRYTQENSKNKEKIYDLYKKYQKKPTIQQFVKNDLPNLDYVLVKLTSSSKMEDEILENNKKLGWNYEKNTFSKIFENKSPTIDEEIEKFEGNFTKKVITSPIRFNFDVEAMDETVDSDKSYNATTINAQNIGNYMALVKNNALDSKVKELFHVGLDRINKDTIFQSNQLNPYFEKILITGVDETVSTLNVQKYQNRLKYAKAWSMERNIKVKDKEKINDMAESLMLEYSKLTSEQKERLNTGRSIKGKEEVSSFYKDYQELLKKIKQEETPKDKVIDSELKYFEYIRSLTRKDLQIGINEKEEREIMEWSAFDEEPEIEGIGISGVDKALKRITKTNLTLDSFIKLTYLIALATKIEGDDRIVTIIQNAQTEIIESIEASELRAELSDIDESKINTDIKRGFLKCQEVFRAEFYKELNALIEKITDDSVKEFNPIRSNSTFMNQMVKAKLLEEV